MSQWTVREIPDLQGRVALVTGANSGLGLETVRALAAKGAHVVMACRNQEKGQQAQATLLKELPQASLELVALDLASLDAVRQFASSFSASHAHLNLLFNNAGVMAIPRHETQDGFEMQFGTNHLAHFALTGLLLPTLLATPQSRIIITTSAARAMGKIRFDDLNRTRSYGRWEAYGQSKLSNLLFAFELQHRLAAADASTISVAAHPGYAVTNLQTTSATTSNASFEHFIYTTIGPVFGQSAQMGALPQLYAGLAPDIHGGELVGPGSLGGLRGYPKIDAKAQKEYDKATASRLWDESVKLTGVDFAALRSSRSVG
ncbi:oxidoreductase [Dictyobacter kobayashii]|uniref:Short-chain dehydrogenase n=1 Tax=Dictyobacter kobayashii TaxID=2014872 RepID=A0A402AV16_9CHLR|nr:oxidoreductase [Dictyobacter kobayashii]GCE22980.1 short-chain dehydrogenase [Dictyobacter kobayashii]